MILCNGRREEYSLFHLLFSAFSPWPLCLCGEWIFPTVFAWNHETTNEEVSNLANCRRANENFEYGIFSLFKYFDS